MDDDCRQVVYPEAWKAKDRETGLRFRMPDKVTHTKVITWEEMIALATKYYKGRKDYRLERTDDGITITYTDWPEEELRLRSKHCPYCFLDWSQSHTEYFWEANIKISRSHFKGCPNGGEKPIK